MVTWKVSLKNQFPYSMLGMSSNVKFTYRLTSFRFMFIGYPIPGMRLFQNLTLKIQGQGHRWGHSSKAQSLFVCFLLLLHINSYSSCAMPIDSTIPVIWLFKNLVKGRGKKNEVSIHSMYCISFLFHVNRTSHPYGKINGMFCHKNIW